MAIEPKDLFNMKNAAGVGSSGLVALACSQVVDSAYGPIISYLDQYTKGPPFEVATIHILGGITVSSGHLSSSASILKNIFRISQTAGKTSALWVGFVEANTNFFRSWKGKGDRPIVVDIMEGGLRGSAVGFMMGGALNREPSYKGLQLATGALIGFISGMMGAFTGSVAGTIFKKIFPAQPHSLQTALENP